MQTVLALPVQQRLGYSPSAVIPPPPPISPVPSLAATSPSTSSTLSDNTSYSFNNIDVHIDTNPALKIEIPADLASLEPVVSVPQPPKSKRSSSRDPNAPYQYTFPSFTPSPGPLCASPSSEVVEPTQRLTKARVPPVQQRLHSPDPFIHNTSALNYPISSEVYASPVSATSSGPGPQRNHRSRLARLLDENPQIAHPYARLSEKHKDTKRRKIWNHTLEKNFFTPEEISTIGAPLRRPTYISSLEAFIDRTHAKLLERKAWYPVSESDLEPFIGLNSKTAKSMVSGLQCDAIVCKLKLLELRRINSQLEEMLLRDDPFDTSQLPGLPGLPSADFMPEPYPLNPQC